MKAGETPILDQIFRHARSTPQRPAVTDDSGTVTYGRIWEDALSYTDSISRLAAEGTAIGLVLPNSAMFVAALLGVARAGHLAVLFPVNITEAELRSYGRATGVRLVLTDRERADVLNATSGQFATDSTDRFIFFALDTDSDRAPDPGRDGTCDGRTSEIRNIEPGDFIGQFTSGIDRPSKTAVRTQEAVWMEIHSVATALGIEATDTSVVLTKISHSYGLIGGTLALLCRGARVIMPGRTTAEDIARIARDSRPSLLFGVPGTYRALTQVGTRSDLSSFRVCFTGGAPFPRDVDDAFAERYGVRVCQDYGTTEAGTVSLRLEWSPQRAASVGRPLPHVSVAIVDDEGRVLPSGHRGAVVIRSPALARGYLSPPDDGLWVGHADVIDRSYYAGLGPGYASPALTAGQHVTGDLGWLDTNGDLFIAGRKSSLIYIDGVEINPAEVEAVIAALPGVRDVAVVGVASAAPSAGARTGSDRPPRAERLKAVVVADDLTEEGVLRYCRARLAEERVPEVIEFRAAIPRTTSGKVLRRALV